MNQTISEQEVIWNQRPIWSSAIIWSIIGITGAVVVWASLTKVESAVQATGKLEPTGSVKEIQTPVAGVVQTLLIKEGSRVKAGETLLNLVPTSSRSQLTSLNRIRSALLLENQYYRSQLNPNQAEPLTPAQIQDLKLSPQILSLTKSRQSFLLENRLYQQQLLNNPDDRTLSISAKARQKAGVDEFQSRLAQSALDIPQIDKQLQENQIQQNGIAQQLQRQIAQKEALKSSNTAKIDQIDEQVRENQVRQTGLAEQIATINQQLLQIDTTAKLKTQQIDKQTQQNRLERQKNAELLAINQTLLARVQNLVIEGAISKQQELKQQQQVITIDSDIKQLDQEYARLELEKPSIISQSANQQQELQEKKTDLQSQLAQLQEQQEKIGNSQTQGAQFAKTGQRLTLARSQAQAKFKNTEATNRKDLHNLMAANENKIAEIDSQLSKAVVENEKQLAEVEAKVNEANLTLKYMELKAPVAGTIFELKAKGEGFVAKESEPVLKIVPDDSLVAQVYITNRDIGFVRQGMKVDIRVDSFPFSEFGDIEGELIEVGRDALPPDEIYPYYRFPAKVKLKQQFIRPLHKG
jgi:hemolysin D